MSKRLAVLPSNTAFLLAFTVLVFTVLVMAGCGSAHDEGHGQIEAAPSTATSAIQGDGTKSVSDTAEQLKQQDLVSADDPQPVTAPRPSTGTQIVTGTETSTGTQTSTESQPTTDPQSSTDAGPDSGTTDSTVAPDATEGSPAGPALVDAMATSIRNGGPGLAGLVGSSGQSRCIADHAMSDIGAERYRSAYGVTTASLQSGTSLLGIAYDRIDAEAVGAAMAACTNLHSMFGQLLRADGMEPEISSCVVSKESGLFLRMLVAELNHDRGLVETIVNKLEDLAEHCTYPLDPGLVPDLTLEPGPEPEPEAEPEPEPVQDQTPPEPEAEPESEPAQDQTPPEHEPEPEPEAESAQDQMPPAQTDSE